MEISLLVGAGLQWQTRSVRQQNRQGSFQKPLDGSGVDLLRGL
jgi:hypothetical protein